MAISFPYELGKIGKWLAVGTAGENGQVAVPGMRSGFAGYRMQSLNTMGNGQFEAMGGDASTRIALRTGAISFDGLSTVTLVKSNTTWVDVNKGFYPNGAFLPGSNGMYAGTFLGTGAPSVGGNGVNTEGMLLYGVMGQGAGPRPFFNVYAVSPDGSTAYTVWSKSFHNDAICDNATVVWNATGYVKKYGVKNFSTAADHLYMGMGSRYSNNGAPFVTFGSFNGASSPDEGGGYRSFGTLSGMDSWGQPLDACDVPNSNPAQPIGLYLWQRQWWGAMVAIIRRTGFNGNSFTHHSVVYLNGLYQSWMHENDDSGNQGAITYSPESGRVYPIFVYEPQNIGVGYIYGGVNLSIHSFLLDGDLMGTGHVDGTSKKNDLINYIWGENGSEHPNVGANNSPSIQYLGQSQGRDALAYAYISDQEGLVIRFVKFYENETNRFAYQPMANGTEFYLNSYLAPHSPRVNQRTRIEVISMDRGTNGLNYLKVALSCVDTSNNTRVFVFTVNLENNTVTLGNDFQPTGTTFGRPDGFRGVLAQNGTVWGQYTNSFPGILRHSNSLVVQGTDANNFTTHIWGQASHGFGAVDQDRSFILKTI